MQVLPNSKLLIHFRIEAEANLKKIIIIKKPGERVYFSTGCYSVVSGARPFLQWSQQMQMLFKTAPFICERGRQWHRGRAWLGKQMALQSAAVEAQTLNHLLSEWCSNVHTSDCWYTSSVDMKRAVLQPPFLLTTYWNHRNWTPVLTVNTFCILKFPRKKITIAKNDVWWKNA